MLRSVLASVPLVAAFGLLAAAPARSDDFQNNVGKGQATLTQIEKLLDGIDARKTADASGATTTVRPAALDTRPETGTVKSKAKGRSNGGAKKKKAPKP